MALRVHGREHGPELPAHSELLRVRLAGAFADAIRAAQDVGQARTDTTPEDLAVIVLSGWHGALLRAKVERRGDNVRPLGSALASRVTR